MLPCSTDRLLTGVWALRGVSTSVTITLPRTAALSYYFLFALFPALLFLTAPLGYLPVEGLQERLLVYARDVLPPDAAVSTA